MHLRRSLALFLVLLVCGLLTSQPAARAEEDSERQELLEQYREIVDRMLSDAEAAPEFPEGRDWLNVRRPLRLSNELKGKVVILDFWCYCCINCIHVMPDLAWLEEKYKDQAFAVVGVHSAKFENERDVEKIRDAVRRYDIHHPVVNDGDFAIWNAYGARSWPTFAVIAPDGRFVGQLRGEGNRKQLDAIVEVLLDRYSTKPGQKPVLDTTPLPIQLERASRRPGTLAYPGKVLADEKGQRLFVADTGHNRILELGLDGRFKRAFGSGDRGRVDGAAAQARFHHPQGMALRDGKLYVCDTGNHALRVIDLSSGAVRTLAGDGTRGSRWRFPGGRLPAEQPTRGRALASPWDVLWHEGKLIVAMAGPHQIWQIDPTTGVVGGYAGDGSERRLDSKRLTTGAFAQPSAIRFDGTWFWVADSESSSIVRFRPGGPIETVAGAERGEPRNLFHFGDEDGRGWGKRFQHPLGLALFQGQVWVADTYNHKLKVVDPKTRRVRTRTGASKAHFQDKPRRFDEPGGLSATSTHIYIADTNNHAIRRLEPKSNRVETVDTSSVPIPRSVLAAAESNGPWPELPGTELVQHKRIEVGPEAEVELQFDLQLPIGWKLTEGAPSMVRIELPGRTLPDHVIKGTAIRIPIPLGAKAEAVPLRVRLLYYICTEGPGATCRVRSVDHAALLHRTEAGPQVIRLADRFTP